MNAEEIKKLLPHRDPFLFIDKVIEISMEHVVAERFVSPNESFFKGHFPNFPIMPGVIIIEAMAQTCGILGSHIMKQAASEKSVYLLCGVEKVRFKKKVMLEIPLDLKQNYWLIKEKSGSLILRLLKARKWFVLQKYFAQMEV